MLLCHFHSRWRERWCVSRECCRKVNRISHAFNMRSMNWSRRRNAMQCLHQLSRVIEINFAGSKAPASTTRRHCTHSDIDGNDDNDQKHKKQNNKRNRNKWWTPQRRRRRAQCNANDGTTNSLLKCRDRGHLIQLCSAASRSYCYIDKANRTNSIANLFVRFRELKSLLCNVSFNGVEHTSRCSSYAIETTMI